MPWVPDGSGRVVKSSRSNSSLFEGKKDDVSIENQYRVKPNRNKAPTSGVTLLS